MQLTHFRPCYGPRRFTSRGLSQGEKRCLSYKGEVVHTKQICVYIIYNNSYIFFKRFYVSIIRNEKNYNINICVVGDNHLSKENNLL